MRRDDYVPQPEPVRPDQSSETIRRAVSEVVAKLDALSVPRSLAEVKPDKEDFDWLTRWAGSLAGGLVERWLRSPAEGVDLNGRGRLAGDEAIGLLLMLLASERARRFAAEGFVWSVVREAFEGRARSVLFDGMGQPTFEHKHAIERAARRLQLRNVFGQLGTQAWYVSVYLQFGFTRRGISRLPIWLSGNATSESIRILLGPAASDSFCDLWFALRALRLNNISMEQARKAVESGPWVLGDWIDELLRSARARPELGTAAEAVPVSTVEVADLPFLSESRLIWDPPSAPAIQFDVVNLAEKDLEADHYDVLINGEPAVRLLRQSNGTYLAADSIRCAVSGHEFIGVLVSAGGEPVDTQQIRVWEPADEVAAFDMATGRLIDPWREAMSTERTYALLASSDLCLKPVPQVIAPICAGQYRLYFLPKGWPEELQILLKDALFWEPYLGRGRRTPEPPPDWAVVELDILPHGFLPPGSRISFNVRSPSEGVGVDGLRLGQRPLSFELRDGSYITEEVELTPDLALDSPPVVASVRRSTTAVITRMPTHLDARAIGAAQFAEGRWRAMTRDEVLTTSEAAASLFRLFLGAVGEDRLPRLALMEGHTFICRAWSKPRAIPGLAGYGLPLSITEGPYNILGGPIVTLAGEVSDRGIVEYALADSAGSSLALQLRRPLEPSEEHCVVVWLCDGGLELVTGGDVELGDDASVWRLELGGKGRPAAVAVAYEGVRVGSYCFPDIVEPLSSPVDEPAAEQSASLLRWLQAPVCSESLIRGVRDLLKRHPANVLAAWLNVRGLPPELTPSEHSEAWFGVLRHLILWSSLPPPTATRLVEFLGDAARSRGIDSPGEVAIYTASLVKNVTPFLFGSVVQALADAYDSGALSVVRLIEGAFTGLYGTATSADVASVRRDLLCESAQTMGVDEGFIEQGIVRRVIDHMLGHRRLESLDWANLCVSMNAPVFRDYLALSVLAIK